VSNEMIRRQRGIAKLEVILTKRRLRWRGQVLRMVDNRISKQALNWSPACRKQKTRTTKKELEATVLEDMRKVNVDWDKAKDVAMDRQTWRSCVAKRASGTSMG